MDLKDTLKQLTDELAEGALRYQQAADAQRDVFMRGVSLSHQPPLLLISGRNKVQEQYPRFNHREIHADSAKMAANELGDALTAMNGGMQAVPSVRSDMGCGIVPALFGVTPLLFEDKKPWIQAHLPKEQLMDMAESDLTITPEFRQGLAHMEYLAELVKGTGVRVYPLDIQGAYDTAHLVLGDAIFYEMYDDPEFVHHLMRLSVAAINIAWDECMKRIPDSSVGVAHYNSLWMPREKGGIKLSEDTSTLLSKAQVDEFVVPYLRAVLEHAGGGYVHYCGWNPHLYDAVMKEPLAHAINFGNPEKHDMRQVLEDCVANGKLYYGSVPQLADGSNEAEFCAILDAARTEKGFSVLLHRFCQDGEAPAVRDAWQAAAAEAMKRPGPSLMAAKV
jgi:hypothetical protein